MINGRASRAILWMLQIWAAFAFVVVGVGKFRNPFWLAAFPRWGYSAGFRMLIGVLEILGGLCLALPQTASYAAILIGLIMLGAVTTLVAHHEPLFPPVFWLIVVSIVGYARRRRVWRPASRQIAARADRV